MIWTFYIDEVQVYPQNQRSLKITEKWEDNFIRDYRKSLSGDIVLMNNHKESRLDYDYLKTLEATGVRNKHTLVIQETSLEDITFEFTFADVNFDEQKETVTIKPTIRDKYTQIEEAEDVEVNVIENGTDVETTCDINSYYYFYGVVYPAWAGIVDLPDYTVPITYTVGWTPSVVILCKELVRLPAWDTPPSGWVEYADLGKYKIYQRTPVIDTFNVGVDFIWSGGLNLINFPPDNPELYTEYKIDLGVYYGLDCSKLWVKKSFYNGKANIVTTKDVLSYSLKTVLNKIISTAVPLFDGSVVSSFLFMDELAGDETDEIKSNYRLLYSGYEKYLFDMSDFRKHNAYENATINYATFAKMIENICKRFKAKWFIDCNGDLRIENVSYWKNQVLGLEISDTDRKYSYDFEEMPNREWYEEQQTWNEDFKKKELLYGVIPAVSGSKEKTNTTPLDYLYTDIDGLNEHIDSISNDGFVLIERHGTIVRKGYGNISTESNIQNVHMSIGNCLYKYHRCETFLSTFTVDDKEFESETIKDIKRKEIEFLNDEIPDTKKSISIWLGEGRVISLEYKLVTEGSFKCELRIHE